MADEDDGLDIVDAPILPVHQAGYLVAITSDPASPGFQRVAAVEVAELAQKAETAVQPGQLGSAAFADIDSFVTPTSLETSMNAMQAQINALSELLAAGNGGGGGNGGGTLPAILPFILGPDDPPAGIASLGDD